MRTRLRVTLVALAASLSAAASTVGPVMPLAEARTRPPNVLIILTDDQRTGLTLMPSTRTRFKREGTSFPNGFATTP